MTAPESSDDVDASVLYEEFRQLLLHGSDAAACSFLIKHQDFDINAMVYTTDGKKLSPAMLLSMYPNMPKTMHALLRLGVRSDAINTMLSLSFAHHHVVCIQGLLEMDRLDVTKPYLLDAMEWNSGSQDMLLLERAIREVDARGVSKEIVELLVKHGASLEAIIPSTGTTILSTLQMTLSQEANDGSSIGDQPWVQALIKKDIKKRNVRFIIGSSSDLVALGAPTSRQPLLGEKIPSAASSKHSNRDVLAERDQQRASEHGVVVNRTYNEASQSSLSLQSDDDTYAWSSCIEVSEDPSSSNELSRNTVSAASSTRASQRSVASRILQEALTDDRQRAVPDATQSATRSPPRRPILWGAGISLGIVSLAVVPIAGVLYGLTWSISRMWPEPFQAVAAWWQRYADGWRNIVGRGTSTGRKMHLLPSEPDLPIAPRKYSRVTFSKGSTSSSTDSIKLGSEGSQSPRRPFFKGR